MTDAKNTSPVGWYVGSYLLRFIEPEARNNDVPSAEFTFWENTIIVKARDLDQAYDRVMAVAQNATRPYRGGPEGASVQWVCEGITDLLPIYEPLGDGAEIMWEEHESAELGVMRQRIRGRGEFFR